MNLDYSNQLLRTQVYDYLRDQMRRGILKPGSLMEHGQITKELGISKTPLRDALLQLQAEGFLTILPQRGVRINILRRVDALWIYEILGALESRVILSVFPKIGQAEIRKFKQINAEMLAVIPDRDFDTFNNKNIEFHDVFLNLSENKLLIKQARLFKLRLYDFPNRDYGIKWETINVEEHQKFIELAEKSDAKSAADFMRDVHWVFRIHEIFEGDI